MEKKYYDIIVSLIKQNDKYSGCEPILDDIVQDVYDHSKVVLGSVTNEDVIAAYLNKVVATSLITVPKKLNFNTKNKHRVISNVEAITKVSLQPKPVVNEIPEIVLETPKEETIIQPELSFEKDLVINSDTEFEETTEEIESFDLQEEVIEEQEELAYEIESEPEIEEEEEEESLFLETNPPVEVFEEETYEEINEIQEQEENILEPIAEFSEAIEPDVDKTLVDNMINGVSFQDNEDTKSFELLEEPSDTLIEEQEDILTEELAESPFIEETPDFDLKEDTEEVEILNEYESTSETYNIPDFNCFSYEPEIQEFDVEGICNDLQQLDSKHPEKKLLQVCKLKYEENLSVAEIAEKLDFSEETVLDILNDIIELVKD